MRYPYVEIGDLSSVHPRAAKKYVRRQHSHPFTDSNFSSTCLDWHPKLTYQRYYSCCTRREGLVWNTRAYILDSAHFAWLGMSRDIFVAQSSDLSSYFHFRLADPCPTAVPTF